MAQSQWTFAFQAPSASSSVEPAASTSAAAGNAGGPTASPAGAGGSSSRGGKLPAVGDVFPSLLSLKLACYDYALHASPPIGFGVFNTPKDVPLPKIKLGCTAHGYGPDPCPFKLDAESDAAGVWTVTNTRLRHSHALLADDGTIPQRMRDRIARALKEPEPSRGVPAGSASSPNGQRVDKGKGKAREVVEEQEAMLEVGDPVEEEIEDAATFFASRSYLRQRKLLEDVQAAYLARGVKVYCWTGHNRPDHAGFKCSWGHGARKKAIGQLCSFSVDFRIGKDHRWRFDLERGSHNHPVSASAAGPGEGPVGSEVVSDRDRRSVSAGGQVDESEDDDESGDDDQSDDNDQSDDRVKEGDGRVHKSLHALRPRITQLALASKLQFPLPTNDISFSNHDEFRIYACAAAIQRGHTLYLRTKYPTSGTFKLACTRSHERHGDARCSFWMKVHFNGSSWKCIYADGGHSGHTVQADDRFGMMLAELPRHLAIPTTNSLPATKYSTGVAAQVPQKRQRALVEVDSDSSASPAPAPLPQPSSRPVAALPSRASIPTTSTPRLPTLNGSQKTGGPSRLPPIGAPLPRTSTFRPAPTPLTTNSTPGAATNSPRFRASTSSLSQPAPGPPKSSLPSTIPNSFTPPFYVPTTRTSTTDDPTAFAPNLTSFLSFLSPSLRSQTPLLLASGITNLTRLATLVLLPHERLVESGWTADLAKGAIGENGIVIKGLPKILEMMFLKGLEKVREEWRFGTGGGRVVAASEEDGLDWAE